MQLARNKLHLKPSRRGQYLTPLKNNANLMLNFDKNVLELTINQRKIVNLKIKAKRSDANQLGIISNTHKMAISRMEAQSPGFIFKKFLDEKPIRQIQQQPMTKLESQKQILDIFSQRAKNQSVKQVSKQSIARRLSSLNENDNKQIYAAYDQLQQLVANSKSFQNKDQLADMIRNKIEKALGSKFAIVIQECLKRLLEKLNTKEQVKIYICNKLLISDLTLIRLYHQIQKQVSGGIGNPFKTMNNINKDVFSYLKSKYPRAKNLFVPLQINQKFEEFNFQTLAQNNMMHNAGFTFTQPKATRIQIITKTKHFLNKLLSQIDQHYPKFIKLLNDQVFVMKQQKLNKVKVKIGRKLPDDTQKFCDFGNDNLEITSPQVFRVMIKWVQDMQMLINQPSKVITKRKGIKTVKFDDEGKPYFHEIRSKRLQEIKVDLIEKISQNKQFREKMSALLNQLDQFNNNLTKTLLVRQCQHAFIKEQDAECLKFAKFNTQFLEWLIVQKFVIIIQVLSKISQVFQHKFFKKLDFINFNVTDLMRASFQGRKQQIFSVFENLKKLERQDKISIVKLKNRLSTSLNDIQINFKLKQSFIICQLQLIISDVIQQGEDKFKSMEDINHIIYELQRSPFGPLSQMALTMGYYDPSIDYEKKIVFKQDWFKQQICSADGQIHQFIQIYDQTTPFVCSWCVKFYGRLENFFERHQCKKCSLQKCKACAFEADRDDQKKTFRRYFLSVFQGINIQEVQSKEEDFITNFFENKIPFLDEEYVRIRDHVDLNTKPKIQSIQNFLYRKQIQYNLRGSQTLYGILLHFGNGKCSLDVIKYSNYQVQLCGRPPQYSSTFRFEQYDCIFFFKYKVYSSNTKNPTLIRVLSNELKFQLYDMINAAKVKILNQNYQVVYIKGQKENRYLLQIIKNSFSTNKAQAQQSIKSVASKMLNKCQIYPLSRKQITLENIGISTEHLNMFKDKSWSKDVLVLNLSYNKIRKIQNALDGFDNLEELYLSNNELTELNLKQETNKKLSILDVSFNELQEIPQTINNYSLLSILTLKSNKIQKLPKMILPNIEQVDLERNRVTNYEVLLISSLESLLILDMSYNKQEDVNWILNLSLPKLKSLEARNMKIKMEEFKLNLNNFPQVQRVDLSDNKLSIFEPIECKNLRKIKVQRNRIKNVEGIFTQKLLFLQMINLQGNQIQAFPCLDLDLLKQLNLSSNQLKDISNIKKCFLPQLQKLNLQYNQLTQVQQLTDTDLPLISQILLNNNKITKLPRLSFPQLKILDLKQNKISDITLISQAQLPKINKISFKDNLISTVPQFDLKQLKQISLSKNKITDFSSLKQVFGIKSLILWKNELDTFPQIKSSSLLMIYLYQNKIKDISNLSTSNIENVKIISLFSNQIEVIPVLNLPQLEKVHLYKNKISDISNLSKWQTPNLKLIQLNNNSITTLPKMSFRQLNTLQLSFNKIQDISQLSNSQLTSLKNLYLKQNNISKVPVLNFKNVETINIQKNTISDISEFIVRSTLPNLRQLNLCKNQIQQFPEEFHFPLIENLILKQNKIRKFQIKNREFFKYLEKIFLSDNCLQFFDFTLLQSSTMIYQIYLSRNPIKNWEFSEYSKIKKLFLVFCNLKQLKSLYLPNLEELNLTKNVLESIEFVKQPGAMVSLIKLSLDFNKLRTLPLMDLPKLTDLLLIDNPLQDLQIFLKSSLPNLKSIRLSKAQEVQQAIRKNNGLQQSQDIQVIFSTNEVSQDVGVFEEQMKKISEDMQVNVEEMQVIPEQIQQYQSQQNKKLKRKVSLATVNTRKNLVAKLKIAFPKIKVFPNI